MAGIGPIMLDIASTALCEEDIRLIQSDLCGGLILFKRNIESPEQVLELTQSIKAINPSIIIAVDQEGGRVQRLVEGFSKLPKLAVLGECYLKDPATAVEHASALGELMALEVQAVGCDMSFAPVLDLGNLKSRVIGDRAFSLSAETIAILGSAYIRGMHCAGMAATGKHFPGHGSVVEDSHLDIPYDHRTFIEIQQKDLKPFIALKNELNAVMPAHIIYSKVDSKPAGFSSKWLQTILREDIGFDGVVFSDDISMKGAAVAGSFAERAEKALLAGCDMVLICNDRQATLQVFDAMQSCQLALMPLKAASQARLKGLKMKSNPIGLKTLKQTERWQKLSALLAQINQG